MTPRTVLLGDSPEVRRRYGAVAVVLGVLTALVPTVVRASAVSSGPGGDMEALGFTLLVLLVVGILALVLPVAAGYRGAGLAVCIGIPTCLVLGLDIAYWTSASVDTLRWTLWRWAGPPVGVLLGFPLGTAGYLVGFGLDRLR